MLSKAGAYFLGEIDGHSLGTLQAKGAIEQWRAAHQNLLEEVEALKLDGYQSCQGAFATWRQTVDRFAAEARKLLPPERAERFDRLFAQHFGMEASGPGLENSVLLKIAREIDPRCAELPPMKINGLPVPPKEGAS